MQVTSGIQCNLLSPSYSTIYAPQGDARSRFVLIQLLEGAAPWEVPAGALVTIRAAKPDGTICMYDTNEAGESAYSVSGSTVTIELVGQVLAAPGPVLMQIDFYNSTGAHLSTFSFCCQVSESVVSDDDIVSSDYYSVLTATLTEMQQIAQMVQAAYGAPLVAATAADMTDHTRVYVYTGSEAGYTNGNWYYWDGTAWASGGVYNSSAVNVDSTPTEGSTNPVSSGGTYTAIAAEAAARTAADTALSDDVSDVKSALSDWAGDTTVTTGLTNASQGLTFSEDNGVLVVYGTPTAARRICCLNGQNAVKTTSSAFAQTLAAGTYRISMSVTGPANIVRWDYTYTTFSAYKRLIVIGDQPKTVTFTDPVMIGFCFGQESGEDYGTSADPTRITLNIESITAHDRVAREDAGQAAETADMANGIARGIGERFDSLTGSINYGYNKVAEVLEDADAGTAAGRLGVKRELTKITLNQSNPGSTLIRTKITGDTLSRAGSTSSVASWTDGITLTPGHIYRIDCKLVSGSVTVATDENVPRAIAYKTGDSTALTSVIYDGFDSTSYFVAPDTAITLAINVSPGTVLDNAVYQIILRDKANVFNGSDAPETLHSGQPSRAGNIRIPSHIYSEKLLDYNYNVDGTSRCITQGICSDGKRFLFFPLKVTAGAGGDDEMPIMCKWDTVTNAPVMFNHAEKSYGHIEDMCFVPAYVAGFDNGNVDRLYVTDMNRSTAAGKTGTIHVLDAETLELLESVQTFDENDDTKNLISLAVDPYWFGVYHVGYSPERELFFTHSAFNDDTGNQQTLAVLDKNGSLVKGINFPRLKATIFGSDCDENYIYLSVYLATAEEDVFDIRMAVFDWDLNPITTVRVDQKVWEIEGACHIGDTFYFSWIKKAGSARTGAYVSKQTFAKQAFFPLNQVFPVDWINSVFQPSSFTPFVP